ncbi:MAG TPA: hypothetical protein VKS60_24810 [Stellaceae bacterium]|nr:hypothetical protein [Stellaceae bacterium]
MGAWGIGLYSSDFAMDLRSTVGAVARLPFEPGRLLELLRASEPTAADDPADEDHCVFWLTVADQFARRGIDCPEARDRALAVIDDGSDLAMMSRLGMAEKDLAKRRKMLEELRPKIAAPPAPGRPRPVLKAPQPLLMHSGDTLAFPVSDGHCINPYFPSKEAMRPAWRQDGWGVFLVVECGHVFEYLAWYRPLVAAIAFADRPVLSNLAGPRLWYLQRAGTCSQSHFRKMELAPLGRLPLDPGRLAGLFPERPSPRSDAVSDISIANRLLGVKLVLDHRDRRLRARTPQLDDVAAVLTAG